MTCGPHDNCGCGLTYEQALVYFENYIANALLCGKLQGGLSACDSETNLPTGTNVVTCAQLQDKINDLIDDGDINIPGIRSLDYDETSHILTLIDQAGQPFSVNLSTLMDKSVQNFTMDAGQNLVLTLIDGTEFTVPLKEFLIDLVKGATLKNGVLDVDNVLHLYNTDGSEVDVDLSQLVPVAVERDGPIIGDGTDENPLDIDFSRVCWQVIESISFTDEGLVIQIANQCDPIILPLDEILATLDFNVKVCVSDQGVITGDGTEGSCLSIDMDKLVDLLINDPDLIINIATALDYKVKVLSVQGVTGDGTTGNPLNVKLSTDAGNLLDLRGNGLYYGTQAAADISNLYIDPSAGDDSNAGNTPSAPLKTLNHAIGMVREDQSSTFHLRAGQVFVLDRTLSVSTGATRTITVYGDPHYSGGALYPDNYPSVEVPYYYPEIIDEVQRPTIRPWVNYDSAHRMSINSMNPTNGGNLMILGVILDAKPVNDVDTNHASLPDDLDTTYGRYNTGMIYGNAAGTVTLRGCQVKTPECPDGWNGTVDDLTEAQWWTVIDSNAAGDVAAVQLNHCYWPEGGNQRVFGMAAASARLYVSDWPNNPVPITDVYPSMESNMRTRLTEERAVSGITKDSDGKPRNITANIVL